MPQIRNQFHPGPQPGSWTPKVAEKAPAESRKKVRRPLSDAAKASREAKLRSANVLATYDALALEKRIERARLAAGWSKSDFCALIGQSTSGFWDKLRAQRLRVGTIARIEAVLDRLERRA